MDGKCGEIVKYPDAVNAIYDLVRKGNTTEDICGNANYILYLGLSNVTESLEEKGVDKKGQYGFIILVRFKFLTKNMFYLMYIISGLPSAGARPGQSRLPGICQKKQEVQNTEPAETEEARERKGKGKGKVKGGKREKEFFEEEQVKKAKKKKKR